MKKSQLAVLVLGVYVIALRARDATRGGVLYNQQCVSCHGDRLERRSGPSLVGGDFQSRWPTSDLIEKIKNTVPQDSPGKLAAGQAADLAAYIQQTGKAVANAGSAAASTTGPPAAFPAAPVGKKKAGDDANAKGDFNWTICGSDLYSGWCIGRFNGQPPNVSIHAPRVGSDSQPPT
jgi:cytochrome c